jgi:hypothetical protein
LAPLREKVVEELFDKLSEEERDNWAKLAKEAHETAVKKWKKETTEGPFTQPADRQR